MQVVEFCLLDIREEVVAGFASPREVGLGRPYALQKSCGECVHAAPPRPGSWVGGTGVCPVDGKGRSCLHWVPSAALAGRRRCRTPTPALREAVSSQPHVVRHMQSVIAGCKAVLPPLPSAETSTTRENF